MRDGRAAPAAWLTADEAARAAGVSRQTVYAWIGAGRLRAVPSDDGMRVDAAELARLLAARRAAAEFGVRPETLQRIARHEGAAASD